MTACGPFSRVIGVPHISKHRHPGRTAGRGFVGPVVTIEQALTVRFLHRVIYAVGEKFAVGAGGRKL